ncbi:MAG TPA: enoyl-CoA hydratase [Roseiarcus sp.]|nr:enoyl-CoA hydratase [Roseiarcus sp.]
MSQTPILTRDDDDGVATLTLSAPGNRNALSLLMIDSLIVALTEIDKDPTIRVAVIDGQGPALSAGHDLKEVQAHRNDEDRGAAYFEKLMGRCADLMRGITEMAKPVIAAVEGVATAAGCQLVAACDLAIAGEAARFALPGVNIGLFCSTPLVAVGRAVSRKAAMELALTGDLIDARRAEAIGLVNRVVAEGRALAEAQALAAKIAARSGVVVALGKRAFQRQIETTLSDAYAIASQAMIENLALADSAEGIAAFVEKRAPVWSDR